MASSSSKPYDGKNLKKLNTLASGDLSWINKKEFKPVDLFPYTYPSSKDFNKSKIKILYTRAGSLRIGQCLIMLKHQFYMD